MVKTFCVLLAFQCLGETISYATAAPVPGPVLGMVLFLCVLCAAPSLLQHVESVSRSLLNHLSLLFVPAGVGVMVFADELKVQLLAIGVALTVSTILAIAVAALVTRALMERAERKKAPVDEMQASNHADAHPD
ncbi:CidA/LrgA family protein [Paraburkholderia silviterrae]|uniref:CidA/LrgA family protein n=1 Tax=Paraburkholderia silviterrae TaxID=2528715 RepID=A0A4R5M4A2_9BURK|nr:CidA/LrgA family protein [Paraburkholderia silviterrae]TDG19915.1 CidA/LrgA family protein [Paraburkholderia silviterrae]